MKSDVNELFSTSICILNIFQTNGYATPWVYYKHTHTHTHVYINIYIYIYMYDYFNCKMDDINNNNNCIGYVVYWPSIRPNMPFQSDAPEGSDTFRWQLWEEIA